MKLKQIMQRSLLVLAITGGPALAKAPASEVAKLGVSLTPVGAEKAGNADGSIPAWEGGLANPPKVEGGRYTNPFAGDKPLFEITAANASQYADKLSPGQIATLNKYPSFKMRVFPSRRSAVYPDFIYEAAKKNAGSTELIADGNGITAFDYSNPFPILTGSDRDKALQVMWNHIVRHRGGSFERTTVQVTPLANGGFSPVRFFEQLSYVSQLTDAEAAVKKDPNVIFYFKQEITAPARLAGNVLLAHETLDQVKEARRAWVYNEGQRRVRRAPQVAYDGPGTASDGLRTTDNFDLFNGAPDRYDWKLVGKKEHYISTNNFDLMSKDLKYTDIVKPGHLNPDVLRYELRRVWVVEANLKPGQRHVYAKRVFFVDEDTWQISVVDHYDGRGDLWRVGEGHGVVFYDAKVPYLAAETLYDLLSGRYIALGMVNEETGYIFGLKASAEDYTPSALRRSGRK